MAELPNLGEVVLAEYDKALREVLVEEFQAIEERASNDALKEGSKLRRAIKSRCHNQFDLVMKLHHKGFLSRETFRAIRAIQERVAALE